MLETNKALWGQLQTHTCELLSIYDQHFRFVESIATSVLGKGPAVEEVCFEVFTSLYYSGNVYLRPPPLRRHLYIVTRVCAKQVARRLHYPKSTSDDWSDVLSVQDAEPKDGLPTH